MDIPEIVVTIALCIGGLVVLAALIFAVAVALAKRSYNKAVKRMDREADAWRERNGLRS